MDNVRVANPMFDETGEDGWSPAQPDDVVFAAATSLPPVQTKGRGDTSPGDTFCCCGRQRRASKGQGATQRVAQVDGTVSELNMVKVSGVGDADKETLRKMFEGTGCGEIVHVFIRRRWDQAKDENTSWGVLTAENAAAADRIVRMSPITVDGRTLIVEQYDPARAKASKGAMRMVQRMTASQIDGHVLEEVHKRMDSLSNPVDGMKLALEQVDRTGVIARDVIAQMQQRLEQSESVVATCHGTRVTILKDIEALAKQAGGKGSHVQLFQDEWLESIDKPRHRYGTYLLAFWWAWIVADTEKAFFQWLDSEDGESGVDMPPDEVPKPLMEDGKMVSLEQLKLADVEYCDEEARKQYEIEIKDGVLHYKCSGDVVHSKLGHDKDADGVARMMYLLSCDHVLYINDKQREGAGPDSKRFHHSSFLAGGPCLSAGYIRVDQGKLKELMRWSGHYRPSVKNFNDMVKWLEKNFDIARGSYAQIVGDFE